MAIEIKKPNPLIRFFQKVELSLDSCWQWKGYCIPDGYGRFWVNGRMVLAHRFAYETFMAPIQEGKELDHLCRNTACVNPSHLEVVEHLENCLRGTSGQRQRDRSYCPQGHPYDEANTYRHGARRHCRACKLEEQRRNQPRRRAQMRCGGGTG